MTKNSYICSFINENPYDWQEKLSRYPYFLNIKQEGNLCIFNYDMLAHEILEEATEDKPAVVARTDFTLPIVQEARGIIINPSKCEVVCWPFRKFGNYAESYVDDIDWKSARVQTKVDGCIMKVYFNKDLNKWMVASNSCIDAHKIQVDFQVNFGKLFDEAADGVLDYSLLDKDKTYIFELVSPKQRIVVYYPETKIYHTGTRSNITGQEFNDDIGVEKPKEFHVDKLSECIEAAKLLNDENKMADVMDVEFEGFVVCDKNFHRIKVKSPEYLLAHHTRGEGRLSYEKLFEIIIDNEIEEYLTYFPSNKEILMHYNDAYFKVISNYEKYVKFGEELFRKLNFDRKAFCLAIKDDVNKFVACGYLFNNKNAEQIFDELSTKNKRLVTENVDNFIKDNPVFAKYERDKNNDLEK